MLRHIIFASIALVLVSASNSFAQITWLNFSGWDHSTVAGAGQVWADIFEDADVTVGVSADNGFASNTSASVGGIYSPNPEPGINTFNFTFSKNLPLVVEIQTTDFQEEFRVTSSTSKTYSHVFGANPNLATDGSSMVVIGTSSGVNPTGASRGLIFLNSPTSSLILSHEGTVANKYERFRVGVLTSPIPEPGTAGMALTAGLALLGLRRRTS